MLLEFGLALLSRPRAPAAGSIAQMLRGSTWPRPCQLRRSRPSNNARNDDSGAIEGKADCRAAASETAQSAIDVVQVRTVRTGITLSVRQPVGKRRHAQRIGMRAVVAEERLVVAGHEPRPVVDAKQ